MQNCTPGAIGVTLPSGWIDEDLFVCYLKHFVACVKPTESQAVVVVLDGHTSHKSIEAVEFARAYHVHLITIPPHTSHRFQPLD